MNRATTKRSRLMTVAAMLSIGCVALLGAPAPAGADADLRAGVYTDAGGIALGGGMLTNLSASPNWYFNPNVEAAFAGDRNVVTLNADFHYDFPSTGAVSFYMGGGPALLFTHPDGGDTRSDAGLNLIGGASGQGTSVRPFMQLKGTLSDTSELAFIGGVHF
jgi:hypothetical protein